MARIRLVLPAPGEAMTLTAKTPAPSSLALIFWARRSLAFKMGFWMLTFFTALLDPDGSDDELIATGNC